MASTTARGLKPTTRTNPIPTNIFKHLHPKIRKQLAESLLKPIGIRKLVFTKSNGG
jgi:hypothetical protein